MLQRDRVLCDLCLAPMGQLHGPATREGGEWDAAFGIAPHFAVCPDCRDASEEPAAEAEPDHE